MNAPTTPARPGFVLRSVAFRDERAATWRRLDGLITKMERGGPSRLSAEELTAVPSLYQATLSGLSVARAISLDRNLVAYLEALCARAYIQVYAPRESFWSALQRLTWREFPRAVRGALLPHVLAAIVLLAAGIAAFQQTTRDPEQYFAFVSEQMASGRDFRASREALEAPLFGTGSDADLTVFAALLFSNNARVGILAFAVGILGGLPTFAILAQNGFILGAMSALFHARDLAVPWWSWILPHGITEILAIVLCGGAGFLAAGAVLFPGDRSRMQAMKDVGPPVGRIVSGSMLLFVVAALIEGIFRQTVMDLTVRYVTAAVTGIFWIGFFAWAGRPRS